MRTCKTADATVAVCTERPDVRKVGVAIAIIPSSIVLSSRTARPVTEISRIHAILRKGTEILPGRLPATIQTNLFLGGLDTDLMLGIKAL
jgi:hypothetical protein